MTQGTNRHIAFHLVFQPEPARRDNCRGLRTVLQTSLALRGIQALAYPDRVAARPRQVTVRLQEKACRCPPSQRHIHRFLG